MPIPNWCREPDPADWSKFCMHTRGHDDDHGYQTQETRHHRGHTIHRTTEVTWRQADSD